MQENQEMLDGEDQDQIRQLGARNLRAEITPQK